MDISERVTNIFTSHIITAQAALDEIKSLQPGSIAEIELANIIDGLKTDDFSALV